MKSIVLMAAVITWVYYANCSITMYSKLQMKKLYADFLRKYPRNFKYSKINYRDRLQIFRRNVHLVEKLNSENSSALFEIGKFADWSDEEFNAFSGPILGPENRTFRQDADGWVTISWDGTPYPPRWDWREQSGVTAVKSQSYKCNSCYAYAVTAVVESLYAIKYKKAISISEYEIIDCDPTNAGCWSGSTRRTAARGKHAGFTDMNKYPQIWWNRDHCPQRGEYFVDKLYAIDANPDAIAWFISNVAPVALNLAFPPRYKFYKSGVLPDAPECWMMFPNHAAEVIGYGVENGKKYWLVKNSWGPKWGENGFFKMERGINACQIETLATSAGL